MNFTGANIVYIITQDKTVDGYTSSVKTGFVHLMTTNTYFRYMMSKCPDLNVTFIRFRVFLDSFCERPDNVTLDKCKTLFHKASFAISSVYLIKLPLIFPRT